MKLLKAMATVAGLTGLSRIAGFIRDILTASILGAGPVADAFFVALKLPNFFRRVTAEGAFSVSFVPLYARTLTNEGDEKANAFASNAFAIMVGALGVLTVLAIAVMPYVIHIIAPGFETVDPCVKQNLLCSRAEPWVPDERFALAVNFSRITFPYLLLMSLAALLGGVLNAHERFAPFAAAPIFFNLCLIGALLLSGFAETTGHALAWGVFVAGIVQFALLWMCVRRAGIRIRFVRPRLDNKAKKLLALMGPGVIGAGVMHINLFADMIIASLLPQGSISYLYYADRLNQLPLGVVGIAVGTALLPMLSKAVAAGQGEKANHLFNRALEICFFLALPAAVGLFIASYPIIAALFEHGAFTREDAAMTTLVLTAYALGMPAYVAVKVYSTAFWARQDTATPVKIAVFSTLFNISLSLYLVFGAKVGVLGIAVATAMAGWIQVALMSFLLKRRGDLRFDAQLKKNLLKITGACALMAAYLVFTKSLINHWYLGDAATQAGQVLAVLVLVGSGAAIYGGAALLSGVIKPDDLKRVFQRKGR